MDKEKVEVKKYTKSFNICLIYLIIAVLLSFYCLEEIITAQFEITGKIVCILVLLVVYILPPSIWMIVLVKTKQVFFDIEKEKKKANKKYEDSNLKIINEKINEFSKNDKLNKIIKNYCSSKNLSMWVLEYACVPLIERYIYRFNSHTQTREKVLNFKIDKWFQYINDNSNYLKFIKKINQSNIDDNIVAVNRAYVLRNINEFKGNFNEQDKEFSMFIDILNLYESLINQGIIKTQESKQEYSYCAFLYLLYRYRKISFYENALECFKNYNLTADDDYRNIIKVLYENDNEEGQMTTALWALNSKKDDFNDLVSVSYDKYEEIVCKELKEIKEKERIENLLDDKKERVKFSLDTIDLMSGEQFESFVTYLFNELGYKATATKLSGDQGIDVVATKGKTKIAIQAKCYSKPVGNHAIMEAVAGAKHYGADKVMVVTNNYFTKSAKELAESNNVILWDRNILKEKMEQI